MANDAAASCSSEQMSDVLEALQCASDGLQVVNKALRNGLGCMVAGAARLLGVRVSASLRRGAAPYGDGSQ